MADLTPEQLEGLRDSGPWTMVDSIRVGPGMAGLSRGWFNTFAAAAQPTYWQFFLGRDTTAIGPWCNRTTERNDYAMRIYRIGLEFHVPPVFRAYADEAADTVWPYKWLMELPQNLQITAKIAGVDELLTLPAIAMPGGVGVSQQSSDVAASGFINPGNNGWPVWSNQFDLPEPIGVPAGAQFKLEGLLDGNFKDFMAAYVACPGNQVFPGCDPDDPAATVTQPLIFSVRAYAWGRRYVQLRGARTAG